MRYFYNALLAGAILGHGIMSASAQTITSGLTEEIIVTAQKREQNVQEIGVTLSALDSEQIRALTLQNLPEITEKIANVELFDDYGSHGLPTWVIRGVGLQDFNANNTPTAAIYVDEVYQVSNVMGAVSLFDTERVEVLKGPQGGLYGRNTSGGAVTMRSVRPALNESSGYLKAAYGSWQSQDFEGAATLPVSDIAALRISANREFSSDAWQSSQVDGRAHGEQDRWNARVWLLVEPGESTRLQWKIYGGADDSELNLGRSVGLYDFSGGFCGAVLQGERNDASCYDLAALSIAMQGGMPQAAAAQAADGSSVFSQPINRLANEYAGSTLILDQMFGSLTLTSITNYENFSYGADFDFDGTALEMGHNLSRSDIEVWSQEVRLASPDSGPLAWIIGASISREDFRENRDFLLRDSMVSPLGYGRLRYDQNTDAYALFGNLDYRFTDRLSIHTTVRYADEEKRYRNGSISDPRPSPEFILFSGLASDYRLDSHLLGNVGLNFQVHDDLLLYASVSKGYKAGGFFGGFPLEPGDTDPYMEETVVAWEAGFKSQWSDRLILNGAVFYYDYRDVQGYVVRPSAVTGTDVELLSNQGDAEHYGLELDLNWAINNYFTAVASVGYLDAEITDSNALTYNIMRQAVPVEGRRPYAPEFSGFLGLQFSNVMDNGLQLSANLDYSYRSDFSGHLSSPVDRAVKHLDAYGLLNGSIFITSPDNAWTFSIWGKNLTDERYLPRVVFDSLGDYIDIPGAPRSAGASIQFEW